jgi:hypothetical protein
MWCCVWVVERAEGVDSDGARYSNIDVVYVDLIPYHTTVHVSLSQEYLNLYTNVEMHFQDVKFRCSIKTPHFSNQHLIYWRSQLRELSHIRNAHSVTHWFPQDFDGNNTLSGGGCTVLNMYEYTWVRRRGINLNTAVLRIHTINTSRTENIHVYLH